MPIDWNSTELENGLACYRRGLFFDAHEHWELAWLALKEPEKSFLQALIQVTAAFHHLEKGNRAGALGLLRKALGRLERCTARFGGIDIPLLCEEVGEWIGAIESGAVTKPATTPRICPVGSLPSSDS